MNQQQHANDNKKVFGGEDNIMFKMGRSIEQPLMVRNDGDGISTHLGGVEESTEFNTPMIGELPPLSQSSRGIDGIFRESNPKSTTSTNATTTSSWSNIVSSSNSSTLSPGSPSSETLVTSNNNVTLLTNTNRRIRSQSFETSSLDYPYNNNNNKNNKDTISATTATSYSHQHYHYHHSSLSSSTTTGGAGMNMMYPATPYLEYKPRGDSISSWEDSTTLTGTTSPMSSPSLSPHVSPAMHHLTATALLPSWQLTDGANNNNDYHHSPTANRMQYPYHLQQSIPEENYDDELDIHNHHQYQNNNHRGYNHNINYMNSPHTGGSSRSSTGPLMSPPRHTTTQHSAMLYPRSSGSVNRIITSHLFTQQQGGGKIGGGVPPAAATATSHHRSTIEVLKTLLRKKACLYEPETSYAISLVTWLVGYKLALLQGYFTRQQLQAGVHACVTKQIHAGYVTRTKVNRCMQVILNSCFHYIIPLPDVEDESRECCNVGGGLAFRTIFANETTSDEEQLLLTLSKPWHDLNIDNVCSSTVIGLFHDDDNEDDDNHHYHPYSVGGGGGGGKHQASVGGKVNSSSSSIVSHADESLDSNKRSVLLCFNENIRCAADIFRCHNEFIRDVAHSGNLNLSSEEWLSFFTGTKAHTRSSGKSSRSGGDTMLDDFHLAGDAHDRMDQQGLAKIRTSWCAKRYEHDHSFCTFAHVDVNRGWLRRDPYIHTYAPQMCPNIKPLQSSDGGDGTNNEDCYMINMCPNGVMCNFAHSREEILYHPERYKRILCRHTASNCPLGDICSNTHTELSSASHHGYNNSNSNNSRQGGGKRHYQDHAPFHNRTGGGSTYHGSKRRAASGGGITMSSTSFVADGFGKFPDASPMLYIDPAPLSEYEKTLVLPGLQALFRDHSSAMVYTTSSINDSSLQKPHQYGPFGYYYP